MLGESPILVRHGPAHRARNDPLTLREVPSLRNWILGKGMVKGPREDATPAALRSAIEDTFLRTVAPRP